MIFSIEDISIWSVFDWQIFVYLYLIAVVLIVYPKLTKIWPLSTFSLLKKRGRWNGIVIFLLVSLIAVVHFIITDVSLRDQKAALGSGHYVVIEAAYDGPQSDMRLAFAVFPESNLSFDGRRFEAPGSLHGSIRLLPVIRSRLLQNEEYRLYVSDGVILKLETKDLASKL